MSTLSKVLAVLNLLALFAYIFLGVSVYSARNAWQYLVFRTELALNGLPLNADEVDSFGMPIAERVSDETLTAIFGPAGGKPPGPTLLDEAKSVRQKVESKFNEAGDAKGRPLAEFLIPLTSDIAERKDLLDAIVKPSDPQLIAKLEERAKHVLTSATDGAAVLSTGNRHNLSANQQKEEIARMLWAAQNLDSESSASTGISRLVALVGPGIAIGTVVESARNLEEIAKQVEKARAEEQVNFLARHSSLVSDLRVKDLKKQQLEMEKLKMDQLAESQVNAHAQRRRDRDKLTADLTQSRDESTALMNDLRTQGDLLYKKRIEVLDAIRKMQEQEKAIRQLEGLKP